MDIRALTAWAQELCVQSVAFQCYTILSSQLLAKTLVKFTLSDLGENRQPVILMQARQLASLHSEDQLVLKKHIRHAPVWIQEVKREFVEVCARCPENRFQRERKCALKIYPSTESTRIIDAKLYSMLLMHFDA